MSLLGILRRGAIKRFVERWVIPAGDVLLAPAVLAAALLLKLVRRVGVYRMTIARAIFNRVGVFPIRDHFYEPMFNPRHLRHDLGEERSLPAIAFEVPEQLAFLERLNYAAELAALPVAATAQRRFYYDNPNCPAGDAEMLYCMIRRFRPARILEIGSGFSTLMMLEAVAANRREAAGYGCDIVCVEPYEMDWLEELAGVRVLRQRVEELPLDPVLALRENDILFIDSSHVLRPQGDLVRIFLELLPRLAKGVLVHIHDIFTPRDYPAAWVTDQVRLYNEQYLFEAFMSDNPRFRILCALNLLAHGHTEALARKLPVFGASPASFNPSSMWLARQ